MSVLIQPVPVLDQYPPNDLALEEALDALDPLRHYFKSFDAKDGSSTKATTLTPPQPSLTVRETVELSFGTEIFDTHQFPRAPISISLAVDASPGCGGIAWPAGQVNLSSSRNIYNSRVYRWLAFDIQVLAEYIAGLGCQFMKGKTVLELGSGTGLVGLVSGALGAETVWITDQAFVFYASESLCAAGL